MHKADLDALSAATLVQHHLRQNDVLPEHRLRGVRVEALGTPALHDVTHYEVVLRYGPIYEDRWIVTARIMGDLKLRIVKIENLE